MKIKWLKDYTKLLQSFLPQVSKVRTQLRVSNQQLGELDGLYGALKARLGDTEDANKVSQ